MANILLGVTGSVAAIKTPELVTALRTFGHVVKVVATDSALYFFDPVSLDPSRVLRNPDVVVIDDDEWPGRTDGRAIFAATPSCTWNCAAGRTYCSWRRLMPILSPSLPTACATTV